MKGWIALDIDGTITADKYSVPKKVIDRLRELEADGWRVAIATGRSSPFAKKVVEGFDFPYKLLVQNGSAALEMPKKKLIYKRYLPVSSLAKMEEAFEGIEGNFLIYSGVEEGNICYYGPRMFSQEQKEYVFRLELREQEKVQTIKDPKKIGDFSLLKCFGSEEEMMKLALKLRNMNLFQVAHIKDPFEEKGQLLLVTEKHASKGETLKELMKLYGRGEKVIAAGDDENDESLLMVADMKIAMPQAPDHLKKLADFIAAPVSEMGILSALNWAVSHAS